MTFVNKKFFGDILEVNAFNAISSKFVDLNTVSSKHFDEVKILKRFYFNSNLKRMSVIVSHKGK